MFIGEREKGRDPYRFVHLHMQMIPERMETNIGAISISDAENSNTKVQTVNLEKTWSKGLKHLSFFFGGGGCNFSSKSAGI